MQSGTGKEVVASAIHRRSSRAKGAFQVVDCTAIPETLFESLLFGHVKGSFTGGIKDQVGLLSQADGGTAFFDEVGELPAALQAKLLRVIQEQTFIPLGKTASQHIHTRFICATNRDLELEVNSTRFRRDLFYRLAVIHLELPPLRRRGDDVMLLANYFLQLLQPARPRVTGFSPNTIDVFKRYSWPGNIRELRNAVEHGLAMARTDVIAPSNLPAACNAQLWSRGRGSQAAHRTDSRRSIGHRRTRLPCRLVARNAGNVARSANQAGMSRQGLHKRLKKHGVDAAEYRS